MTTHTAVTERNGPAMLDVSIDAGGVALAGVLRLPDGPRPSPALVFTGPFTGVKEQVTGTYAERLAAHGFATLAFDHRNFGASGATRPHHEDPAGKLSDLRAATSWLAARPEIDPARIGCVGICLGGGYALRHSAVDRRIRALAVVAGAFNDPRAMRSGVGADQYRHLMEAFAATDQREYDSGTIEYIKAVSDVEGEEAAMSGPEPFEYYGTDRSASPGWTNRVTRLSVRSLFTTDLAMGAEFIAPTPTLVVHGRTDDYCTPEQAAEMYERIGGPKDVMWLDTTNHIDLYDQEAYVGPAVEQVTEWMTRHLS